MDSCNEVQPNHLLMNITYSYCIPCDEDIKYLQGFGLMTWCIVCWLFQTCTQDSVVSDEQGGFVLLEAPNIVDSVIMAEAPDGSEERWQSVKSHPAVQQSKPMVLFVYQMICYKELVCLACLEEAYSTYILIYSSIKISRYILVLLISALSALHHDQLNLCAPNAGLFHTISIDECFG